MRTVVVFGNPDLAQDSLPLRILLQLKGRFPDTKFLTLDPNEEWNLPEEFTVIDTVQGIDDIKVFTDLDTFVAAPRLSMHDFDALANLRLLKKLGKIQRVEIIGVPQGMKEEQAVQEVGAELS